MMVTMYDRVLEWFWVRLNSPDFRGALEERLQRLAEEEDITSDSTEYSQYELENELLLSFVRESGSYSDLIHEINQTENDFFLSFVCDYLFRELQSRDYSEMDSADNQLRGIGYHLIHQTSNSIETIRGEAQWETSESLMMTLSMLWERRMAKVSNDLQNELGLTKMPPEFDTPELKRMLRLFKRQLRSSFIMDTLLSAFRWTLDYGLLLQLCFTQKVLDWDDPYVRTQLWQILESEWDLYERPNKVLAVRQMARQSKREYEEKSRAIRSLPLPLELIEYEIRSYL